ncbi:hypothetical protein J6590_072230 [Homalodisca vitripennis]|nr:hypothetical protein J6590_072230 [Homalodisca vitripennis]
MPQDGAVVAEVSRERNFMKFSESFGKISTEVNNVERGVSAASSTREQFGGRAVRQLRRRKTKVKRNAVAKNKTKTVGIARYASVMYGVQSVRWRMGAVQSGSRVVDHGHHLVIPLPICSI